MPKKPKPKKPNPDHLAAEQLEEMIRGMIDQSSVIDFLFAVEEVLRERGYEDEADLIVEAATL